ncbi:toxin-antitoxin system, toxin component family protein [Heyndrickxia coagulans]|uniref:Toxin-antitoxin system, toxin component family protein n=1 Tax=Heyndrickxia coagulans TaxID=1398 RepID=A0A133KWV1_HEYCO|nr:toxin-antitoxin system, toxin component family protein [Heyndrickxia coagulans]
MPVCSYNRDEYRVQGGAKLAEGNHCFFKRENRSGFYHFVRFVCKRICPDVDIAFYKEGGMLTPYECFLYAQELADRLNKDVDLIDLNHASTVFQAQIFATGIVMDIKNENALNVKRMLAYSLYAKLNEERAEILKNIAESGAMYGR